MSKFEELWNYVETVKPEIENSLKAHLPRAPHFISTNFNDAMQYALFPGGKRLRPVLTLLGAEIVGGSRAKILPTAAAIEFVHTSSLIFDDLPCMDDAAERRGKTSLHQKYGQGTAVLVGLALLNASYGLVFTNVNGNSNQAIRAHTELVDCIGASGMVGGQSVDLEMAVSGYDAENTNRFETLKNLKTSALMRMALRVGAILSSASDRQLDVLSCYADLLGDAYQTSDDLLDLEEDLQISNVTTRRQTFALEQGIGEARDRIADLIAEAKSVLQNEFGRVPASLLLCSMADYIAERKA